MFIKLLQPSKTPMYIKIPNFLICNLTERSISLFYFLSLCEEDYLQFFKCVLTTPVRWLLLLQVTVLSQSAIVVYSKFLEAFLFCNFVVDFFFGIGAFVIGLSQISFFFSPCTQSLHKIEEMRTWSILLIKSELKWCIHISRSFFYILTLPNWRWNESLR